MPGEKIQKNCASKYFTCNVYVLRAIAWLRELGVKRKALGFSCISIFSIYVQVIF